MMLPAALALHGALGGPEDWSAVGRKMRVEAVDLFGDEEDERELRATRNLVSAGEFISSKWGGERRVLAGYSMGARVALHALLADGGSCWSGAVILGAHPGLEDRDERQSRRDLDAGWAEKLVRLTPEAFMNDWNLQGLFSGKSGGVARWNPSDRRRESMAVAFRTWSLGAQEPLWERLGEIQVPVTWMVGAEDVKFLSLAERAIALLPEARLVRVPSCGHRLLIEAPGLVAEEIQRLS